MGLASGCTCVTRLLKGLPFKPCIAGPAFRQIVTDQAVLINWRAPKRVHSRACYRLLN